MKSVIMTRFDFGNSLVGMKLEKLLVGGRIAQAAHQTHRGVVDLENLNAPVWARNGADC